MDNKYVKRLEELSAKMRENGIDFFLVPMGDYHGSEYSGKHFACIEYLTGFTGSAGMLLMENLSDGRSLFMLWTDGRYFLQAAEELKKSGVKLMKSGEEGVPEPDVYLSETVKARKESSVIGFDGRVVSASKIEKLRKTLDKVCKDRYSFVSNDLAGKLWDGDKSEQRPPLSSEAVWEIRKNFSGRTRPEKLSMLRAEMKKEGVDAFVITALDETAWLFNLRGNDVLYNPVFLSYAIIEADRARLYLNTGDYPRRVLTPMLFDSDPIEALEYGIKTANDHAGTARKEKTEKLYALPYAEFFDDLEKLAKGGARIAFDGNSASEAVKEAAESGKTEPKNITSPIIRMKAIKNRVEIENVRQAHIYDGVALTKLIYWLKTAVRSGRESATELSVAEKLKSFRKLRSTYIDESFAPIIAYGKHGAIVHYEADAESNIPIGKDGFLLMDTGGHYLEGTTDVTRTIAMGKPSSEEKSHYTAVLQGNLRLADAIFKAGTEGSRLDMIAREPLYRMGLDFNHGTGHGVGYLLNVHEGPQSISIRRKNDVPVEAGMITSNEPGVYFEDRYGIRLENLILCKEQFKTRYGSFLGFETLTMVPFDPEAIDWDMLGEQDRLLLADYHRKVFMTLSPYLEAEESEWLEDICGQ